ncbi:MAG: hypothetical protein PW788_13635 [Micavibrio sp.]|nr:hypothetical protein [Micavibrio sp.]
MVNQIGLSQVEASDEAKPIEPIKTIKRHGYPALLTNNDKKPLTMAKKNAQFASAN